MTSYELDCLHSFLNSATNADMPQLEKFEDFNGFWLLTLSNGSTIEIHYKINLSEESKTKEVDEAYWDASNEADESLIAHVNRRL